MTQPLALVYYQKLMPGSQLVNRLQDLHYRVISASETEGLVTSAKTDGPMLIFVDLEPTGALDLIARLRADQATSHVPLIGFGAVTEASAKLAQQKGATLVVGEPALLSHLPDLLEQALRVE